MPRTKTTAHNAVVGHPEAQLANALGRDTAPPGGVLTLPGTLSEDVLDGYITDIRNDSHNHVIYADPFDRATYNNSDAYRGQHNLWDVVSDSDGEGFALAFNKAIKFYRDPENKPANQFVATVIMRALCGALPDDEDEDTFPQIIKRIPGPQLGINNEDELYDFINNLAKLDLKNPEPTLAEMFSPTASPGPPTASPSPRPASPSPTAMSSWEEYLDGWKSGLPESGDENYRHDLRNARTFLKTNYLRIKYSNGDQSSKIAEAIDKAIEFSRAEEDRASLAAFLLIELVRNSVDKVFQRSDDDIPAPKTKRIDFENMGDLKKFLETSETWTLDDRNDIGVMIDTFLATKDIPSTPPNRESFAHEFEDRLFKTPAVMRPGTSNTELKTARRLLATYVRSPEEFSKELTKKAKTMLATEAVPTNIASPVYADRTHCRQSEPLDSVASALLMVANNPRLTPQDKNLITQIADPDQNYEIELHNYAKLRDDFRATDDFGNSGPPAVPTPFESPLAGAPQVKTPRAKPSSPRQANRKTPSTPHGKTPKPPKTPKTPPSSKPSPAKDYRHFDSNGPKYLQNLQALTPSRLRKQTTHGQSKLRNEEKAEEKAGPPNEFRYKQRTAKDGSPHKNIGVPEKASTPQKFGFKTPVWFEFEGKNHLGWVTRSPLRGGVYENGMTEVKAIDNEMRGDDEFVVHEDHLKVAGAKVNGGCIQDTNSRSWLERDEYILYETTAAFRAHNVPLLSVANKRTRFVLKKKDGSVEPRPDVSWAPLYSENVPVTFDKERYTVLHVPTGPMADDDKDTCYRLRKVDNPISVFACYDESRMDIDTTDLEESSGAFTLSGVGTAWIMPGNNDMYLRKVENGPWKIEALTTLAAFTDLL